MKTKRKNNRAGRQANIHLATEVLADPQLLGQALLSENPATVADLGDGAVTNAAHESEQPRQGQSAVDATPEHAHPADSPGEPATDVGDQPTADATPSEKLHGATFDGDPEPDSPPEESPTNTDKISDILDQLVQGFSADDATNFEKLTIARKYGALLLELKKLVPHGKFKETLRDRFPKVSYSKCNRWMWLAEREAQVAEAIEKYPDVSWGPKKMIDFLNGSWRPEEEDEEDDEEDAYGYIEEGAEPNIVVVRHQEETEPEPTQPSNAPPQEATTAPEPAPGPAKWETVVGTAEAEAAAGGSGPATPAPASQYKVTVTVFSEDEQTTFFRALSRWSPISSTSRGARQTRSVTAQAQPTEIGMLLERLGNALEETMPKKLNVSIEL